ncbi:restriction endonuclease subunit S [Eubacterium ventriosum]|uniref:Restriction endonuclease subunit S n=1 Tax=Eubacterium ventriosum TaxID=39496 RepID=A0A413RZ08_9FIRM|nr:restriction endonuclease subunit S [Eubacterium ventriosum]RHA53981.1 restriction endonuclease subunit S [Eubacterium ventriosum]
MVRKLKHTDIGDIPVDWELQTFDETFRVLSNNTLSRENLNNRGGAVRNIHYGDILTKFPEVLNCKEEIPYVNELSLLSSSTQLLQDGDIVIADTAEDETVGKVTEVQNLGDSKLVAGLHTIPCRVKKGDFAPGWLGYYMNSNLFHNQILPYITGIKVSSISKGAISETLILVPPFDEQEKIVQSLNEVQLLMTAETKVVNKMKFVKNGCLSKMFPQKDATVPEMRLPGFTEAWEQRKFSDVGTVAMCKRIFKDQTSDEGEVPFYKIGTFGGAPDAYITRELFEEYKKTYQYPSKGDILISASGSIGRTIEYTGEDEYFQDSNIVWLKHGENLDNSFLKVLYSIVEWSCEGSTIKRLYNDNFLKTEFMLPKIDEQIKIGKYFRKLDHLITLHQCKCDKYSNIKKGMMSDLLTGKIRLV